MLRMRYRRILWFFARNLLKLAWWDIILPYLGMHTLVVQTRPRRLQKIAESFRKMAVQMGGVMIKVGQFLSARLDVLPHDITDQLSGLQDEVTPETYAIIRTMIEEEFNTPLEEKFSEFEETPLASASIGQVHRARLRQHPSDLKKQPASPLVVVKVQRPNINKIVETDLAALRVVCRWLYRYPPIHKRINVLALLDEFSRSIYEEIDYLAEGKNAETFAINFRNRPEIRIPRIFWSHTTRRVITLEDVYAIKITDYHAIEAAGINRSDVAERLFDTYLKQIFEDHYFHADPHPGNLFVFPSPVDNEAEDSTWKLVFVDFGMVGSIPQNMITGLRELLIAIGTRDSARAITAYQMLNLLLPGADLNLLEKAGDQIFERFWGKTTIEMMNIQHYEVLEFIEEFGNLLYTMPLQIPENFIWTYSLITMI